MNPIKVILADNDKEAVSKIKAFISDLPEFELVGLCDNGEQLVHEVMVRKPDLVVTSIGLPKTDGLQAMKECRMFYPTIKCIFVTGCKEYAIEAFNLSAIDFIIKPASNIRLLKALEKAKVMIRYESGQIPVNNGHQQRKLLLIKEQNATLFVPIDSIYFIEKAGKKSLVYTKNEMYETNDTLGMLAERLTEVFYHTHRSYIINLKKISQITPRKESYIVNFQDFDQIAKISKLKINEVREQILQISGES